MKCKCGFRNRLDAEYCQECGLLLRPKIEKKKSPGAQFAKGILGIFVGILIILFGLFILSI